MPCHHQTKLYQLMEQTGMKLASSDIIRITCRECGEIEVCPSVHLDEYEQLEQAALHPSQDTASSQPPT